MRWFNSLLGFTASLFGFTVSLFGSARFPVPGPGNFLQTFMRKEKNQGDPAPDGKFSLHQGISLRRGARYGRRFPTCPGLGTGIHRSRQDRA
jgi:hypothetical protein